MERKRRNGPTKAEIRQDGALGRLCNYTAQVSMTMVDVDLLHILGYFEQRLLNWPGETSDIQYRERYAMYQGYLIAARRRNLVQ